MSTSASDSAPTVSTPAQPGMEPPNARGGLPWLGHIIPFARNPYRFMQGIANTYGDIVQFTLLGQRMVLLTGDHASEVFYRASDEQLDQSAAYKLMTPIFGHGIVFDAPTERKNQQLKMLMPALRMEAMRHHSEKIVAEVQQMMSEWGDAGELDLVHAMKQLTINTASHCLLGREFRYELTDEFAAIYHDLERGVNALAYHYPNLPIPAFRKRDHARRRLQALVGNIVKKRANQADKPSDMFQLLIETRYDDGSALDDNEITGMLIAAIFAGHHTSSGTAAWVLLELLKHPHYLQQVRDELDALLGDEKTVSFQQVRDMPILENVVKEVLRLHPPLIMLLRKVNQPLQYHHYALKEGDMVVACPPVTHRLSNLFPNPEVFDPERFNASRREDKNLMAYQPFGGGKHKCSGNAFALFQIKAIFAILLRHYDFELIDPPDHYQDDYGEMIVQPTSPCRIRYRRRQPGAATRKPAIRSTSAAACPHAASQTKNQQTTFQITVDPGLCQGHAMCMGEAPALFRVDEDGNNHVRVSHPDLTFFSQAQRAAEHCPNQAIRLDITTPNTPETNK